MTAIQSPLLLIEDCNQESIQIAIATVDNTRPYFAPEGMHTHTNKLHHYEIYE